MWFVYIVENLKGQYYTGITTDPARRLTEHKQKQTSSFADSHQGSRSKGARFFNLSPAQKIVYLEAALNRSQAAKREAEIKHLRRCQKQKLLSAFNYRD